MLLAVTTSLQVRFNCKTIKSVTASDMTNDMAAFTIALAPHMKATATSVGTNTEMKVDIISD